VLAVVCAWRIGFPLELEWMEGGSLHQALRLQQGLAIYPEPSAEFVPFLYTPFYSAVLAGLGLVLPLGYSLGRVVSVVAAALIGLGLWRLVGREGKPRAHQAAAVGMWCAGYVFTFRWYDVARADSLFLALLLWGLVLLRDARGGRGGRWSRGCWWRWRSGPSRRRRCLSWRAGWRAAGRAARGAGGTRG
jgi:hypothetical protein